MERKQLIDILMIAVSNALSNLHTVAIARITAVNDKTINCRPVTNRVVDGKSIELPEFIEVPVWVLQGGGSHIAMPIAIDDYCLLLFTERCFDRWWDGQDYQPPLELRMHDYSDGIALVGINPLAAALTIPSLIHIGGNSEQVGDHELTGELTHTGGVTRTGDVEVTGKIDGTEFLVGGVPGVTGAFTTADGKAVTVIKGIITAII